MTLLNRRSGVCELSLLPRALGLHLGHATMQFFLETSLAIRQVLAVTRDLFVVLRTHLLEFGALLLLFLILPGPLVL